jgi:predicted ATP-grasp superfamily ATP-dependent carboligase
MADLFQLEAPEIPRAPVLISAVDSWIDAGLAAARARSELLQACDVSVVGSFDSERLVDHQARRPVMHIVDGVNTGIDFPDIGLHLGADRDGRRFLIVTGAEPDRFWRSLARQLVDIARQAGVRQVFTLGAYPAPVPHTRPAKVVATATSQELANRVGFLPGQLDVPSGFNGALERACAEAGLVACGLWAQVPHYVANLPYPGAALALLEQVRRLTDLRVDVAALQRAASDTTTRLDGLVAGNPEHVAMVAQLERSFDEQRPPFPLPTRDELAAEVEQFLRNQDD